MMKTETFLVEIGTEELPPKALLNLSTVFLQEIKKQLEQQQFIFKESVAFATPH